MPKAGGDARVFVADATVWRRNQQYQPFKPAVPLKHSLARDLAGDLRMQVSRRFLNPRSHERKKRVS